MQAAVLENLVHVPDADIASARPNERGRRGVFAAGGRPVHRDLRRGRKRRHGHPDERLALVIPRVDVERKKVVVFIREPEAVRLRAVRVGEALKPGLGDADEDREVRERRGGRGREREFAVEVASGRRPLRLERRHRGDRAHRRSGVVRRGEPAGVGGVGGEGRERGREGRGHGGFRAKGDRVRRGAVRVDEPDAGRIRALAERAERGRHDRTRRRHVRNLRGADAQGLGTFRNRAERAVGGVRHRRVLFGDPFGGRSRGADADFVEAAVPVTLVGVAVGAEAKILLRRVELFDRSGLLRYAVDEDLAGGVVVDGREMDPVVCGPAGPFVGGHGEFARIRRAERDLADGIVDGERVAVLDGPIRLATDHAGVGAKARRVGMGHQRDRERVVHAKRRPGGVVGVGDGLGAAKPEDLADAAVRVDDVGRVVLDEIRDETVRGLRRVAGEVPDGVVVGARPDGGRGGQARRRAGGVPVHRDRRGVGERGDGDPDQRLAFIVPRIDVAGDRVVVRVREPEAAARGTVRVGEARGRALGEPHENGEVRERGRWRGRERELARELGERGRGEKRERRGERAKGSGVGLHGGFLFGGSAVAENDRTSPVRRPSYHTRPHRARGRARGSRTNNRPENECNRASRSPTPLVARVRFPGEEICAIRPMPS